MSFSYIDPHIIMDGDSYIPHIKKARLADFDEIYSKIYNYFTRINRDELLGGLDAAEKYKFSFYENIWKVPPYSYIFDVKAYKDIVLIMTQLLSKYGGPGSELDLKDQLLTQFLGVESFMYYMKTEQPDNLFLRLSVLDQETGKYIPDVNNDNSHYKIHLCVKEEYAFYTFLKLALLVYSIFEKGKYLVIKWNMAMRTTKISEADKDFIKDNGGPGATLVLYTQSASAEVVKSYLDAIIRGFPEEATIGLMNLDGNITLPYGNVRLNHLICYAQGDRTEKMKKYKNKQIQPTITPWMAEIASRGERELSQLYLGLDSPEEFNNRYIALDDTLLDPRTVNSIVKKGGRRRKNRTSKRKSRK